MFETQVHIKYQNHNTQTYNLKWYLVVCLSDNSSDIQTAGSNIQQPDNKFPNIQQQDSSHNFNNRTIFKIFNNNIWNKFITLNNKTCSLKFNNQIIDFQHSTAK